jgi:hypothetical protein
MNRQLALNKIGLLSQNILQKLPTSVFQLKFVMEFTQEKIILMIVWVLYYIWHQNKLKGKFMERE